MSDDDKFTEVEVETDDLEGYIDYVTKCIRDDLKIDCDVASQLTCVLDTTNQIIHLVVQTEGLAELHGGILVSLPASQVMDLARMDEEGASQMLGVGMAPPKKDMH